MISKKEYKENNSIREGEILAKTFIWTTVITLVIFLVERLSFDYPLENPSEASGHFLYLFIALGIFVNMITRYNFNYSNIQLL